MELQIIPQSEKDRFMSYVYPDPNTGCFLWGGGIIKTGYGVFNAKVPGLVNMWRAHRFSWLVHDNKLIEGLDLCHTCDNRLCVNPDHLWMGTRQENLLDCKQKKRNPHWIRTHCKKGHEYTEDNILRKGPGRKYKECKECRRINYRLNSEKINARRKVKYYENHDKMLLQKKKSYEKKKAVGREIGIKIDAKSN